MRRHNEKKDRYGNFDYSSLVNYNNIGSSKKYFLEVELTNDPYKSNCDYN